MPALSSTTPTLESDPVRHRHHEGPAPGHGEHRTGPLVHRLERGCFELACSVMNSWDIIAKYHDLWQVEQSFRMSKTDLRARPMFHRTRDAIGAHLTIVFAALTVARDIQDYTGLAIGIVVKQLRQLRTSTIVINGATESFPSQIPAAQPKILADVGFTGYLQCPKPGRILPVRTPDSKRVREHRRQAPVCPRSAIISAVPTGTVDFPTCTAGSVCKGAKRSITDRSRMRPAAYSSRLCGVATAIK